MNTAPILRHADGILRGIVYALLIGAMALFDGAVRDDLAARMCFGLAVGIMTKRQIDTATMVLAATNGARWARIVFGTAQALPSGMAAILAFWPLATAQIVIWAFDAAVFGAIIGGIAKPVPVEAARRTLYHAPNTAPGKTWPIWGPALFISVLALAWAGHQQARGDVPIMWLGQMVVFLSLHSAANYAHRGHQVLWAMAGISVLALGYLSG